MGDNTLLSVSFDGIGELFKFICSVYKLIRKCNFIDFINGIFLHELED